MIYPKVSIIIPSYNAEKYIGATINSVLEQTYKNIELIVVDDGSCDKTINILEGYKTKLKILLKNNEGTASARNLGIKSSTGKYLVFLDNDDLLFSESILNLVEKLILNPSYKAAYGDGYGFRDLKINNLNKWTHTPKYSGNIFEYIIRGLNLMPGQYILDKECVSLLGGFDEIEKMAEDWSFLLKISKNYDFLYVPTPVLKKRTHLKMKTLNKDEHIIKKRFFVIKNTFGLESKFIIRKYLSKKILSEWYRTEGLLCISEYRDNKKGIKCMLRSLKLFPFQPTLLMSLCYNKFIPSYVKIAWKKLKQLPLHILESVGAHK